MLQMRPMIRFDGFYRCKMRYFKDGENNSSEYNPIIEVISYKYIRFLPNGETLSILSVMSPKRIFERLKYMMLTRNDVLRKKAMSQLQMSTGTFSCYNDKVVID